LDTSFVQPLFGLEIKISEDFTDQLSEIWKNGIKGTSLHISNISLLECLYLLNREYRDTGNEQILERYEKIIPTISKSRIVSIINSLEQPEIINHANVLRATGHTDYLDCLIFGTANENCDIIVTRERELRSIISGLAEFSNLHLLNWFEFVEEFL